jgi:hypothetical protein
MRKQLSVAIGMALVTGAMFAGPATAAGEPTCGGKKATIVGTNKSETIKGTAKADVIHARGGNDTIYGFGGNDIICGGPGRDKLIGGSGNDRLASGLGADKVYGGTGNDRIFGARGADKMDGGHGDDDVYGGPGVDRCRQGVGNGPVRTCEDKALVVAYINDDGVDGYTRANDTLIAGIFDVNGDGEISVGDEVRTYRYPLDFEATSRGRFGVETHRITSISGIAARSAKVGPAAPKARVADSAYRWVSVYSDRDQFWFESSTYAEGEIYDWWYEGYGEYSSETRTSASGGYTSFYEYSDYYYYENEVWRSLSVDSASPSVPNKTGYRSEYGNGDSDWFDVDFYVTPPTK